MKTLWTLQIITNWFGPGDGNLICGLWQAPEQQDQYHPAGDPMRPYGIIGDTPNTPWAQQKPITIIGFHIVHQVAHEDWGAPAHAMSHMVVGSGHGGDGADVFAQTGGNGSSQQAMMFPHGVGLPQGLFQTPNYAHIDVYGSVYTSGLRQRGLVTVYYVDINSPIEPDPYDFGDNDLN